MKNKHLSIQVVQAELFDELSFEELCQICQAQEDLLKNLVEEEVLIPITGVVPHEWRFNTEAIRRARKATRISKDLAVHRENLALVVELLEEIESLRERVRALEHHLF